MFLVGVPCLSGAPPTEQESRLDRRIASVPYPLLFWGLDWISKLRGLLLFSDSWSIGFTLQRFTGYHPS